MSAEGSQWAAAPFTEKAFYLAEFRGRTLALACDAEALAEAAGLREVLAELEANRTRILLLVSDPQLARALDAAPVEASVERQAGSLWRALGSVPRAALILKPGERFAAECREVATRLALPKLVFLDPLGCLARPDGKRVSFVDLGELRTLLAEPAGDVAKRAPLLHEIKAALEAGVPAVNLCAASGLADELFSYAGSGTLFTRERYVEVRPLGLDDLGAAGDLIARGVAEGYLAERDEAELDRIFAGGFGAFVEGQHLAGIGALLPHPASRTGEIASLYTLTRFLGEGIGRDLVAALCAHARERDQAYVFACTTREGVARFFERQGFRAVSPQEIPAEKWRHYDPARRPRVHCLRFDWR